MDALELISNLQKLDIPEIAARVVSDKTNIIADLNATQLALGLRADGSETAPSYSDITIEAKQKKSGLSGISDRVTLYDTGDFYSGLYAAVQGEDIIYGSSDEKEPKLDEKYSTVNGSIFGLTDNSKEDLVVGYLQPAWQTEIEKITGLQFDN